MVEPETETAHVGVPELQAAEPPTKVVPAGTVSVTTRADPDVEEPVLVARRV